MGCRSIGRTIGLWGVGIAMTNRQQQARALGDPTRHEMFRYLADRDVPVTVAELTDHFGLNHNAIRQHLAKLRDAELVVEAVERSKGPGRPKLLYAVDPRVDSVWGVTGPYERLSLMLAEMVRTGDAPVEVGRRFGRRERLERGDDAVSILVDQMAHHGFDPTVEVRGGRVELTLRSCPFESTAFAEPEVVCALHLGIAEGVAEEIGSIVIDELVVRDPRRANCRLLCHRTDGAT